MAVEQARSASVKSLNQKIESVVADMETWAGIISERNDIDKYLEATRRQQIKSKFLPSGLLLVCSDEFPVDGDPKPHDYSHLFKGIPEEDDALITHALHHVNGFNYDGNKIWLGELDLFTSKHVHEDIELQRILYGKVKVNGKTINVGETNIVIPNTFHRAEAIDGPAVMLCTLMNAAEQDDEEIHKF
jgi:hypothetical protein